VSEIFRGIRGPLREVPALQTPNADRTIGKWRLFDLSSGEGDRVADRSERMDARLILDRASLAKLEALAASSLTGRVAIHGVVFEFEECETKEGHRYILATFSGFPASEMSSLFGS
jgi:hypothetical protein